jgi:hypothetical protein
MKSPVLSDEGERVRCFEGCWLVGFPYVYGRVDGNAAEPLILTVNSYQSLYTDIFFSLTISILMYGAFLYFFNPKSSGSKRKVVYLIFSVTMLNCFIWILFNALINFTSLLKAAGMGVSLMLNDLIIPLYLFFYFLLYFYTIPRVIGSSYVHKSWNRGLFWCGILFFALVVAMSAYAMATFYFK